MNRTLGDIAARWLLPALLLLALLLPAATAPAQPPPATRSPVVSVFWREGCPHCARELAFLRALGRDMPALRVRALSLADPASLKLFERTTERLGLPRVTPITVIGRRALVGFDSPETTGAEIRRLLATEPAGLSLEEVLAERAAPGAAPAQACPATGPCPEEAAGLRYVNVPLLGRVEVAQLTLPALSVVLGLVDGFNPCAMWVLVAFLTALTQAGSLRRMVQMAGIFILAEAVMYMTILNTWFLAFDWIRADRIVTPLVGLVAIGGGLFFLWESRQAELACRITNLDQRARTMSRLQRLAQHDIGPLAVLAILGLAFSVNIIEFACSVGIPQAYTKILDLNRVGWVQRELLMSIYIFFYMLDDLVVFGLAIWGIEKLGLTARYSRISNVVGGMILLALGALMLLAPQALRF